MLLSCGDALIDFLPVKSADGRDAIVPVAGGSCLNIAVGMARLGAAAGFVGGISTDLFGRMIADHAMASGSSFDYATRSDRPEHACLRALRRRASRNMPSMTKAAHRETGPIASGSIPFDRNRRDPCRIDHAGQRKRRGAGIGDGRGGTGDRPPSLSIRIAGPTSSGTSPAMSQRMAGVRRRRRSSSDVRCRF